MPKSNRNPLGAESFVGQTVVHATSLIEARVLSVSDEEVRMQITHVPAGNPLFAVNLLIVVAVSRDFEARLATQTTFKAAWSVKP
ncbi:MAG: hypothetical protein ACPGWS_05460 [Solirubrobacterales bacterium]